MTKEQIESRVVGALDTKKLRLRFYILSGLVKEDPENEFIQLAQAELAGLYLRLKREDTSEYMERAEELLKNPVAHEHSAGLFTMGMLRLMRSEYDALEWFCKTWKKGSQYAEAAAARVEEYRKPAIEDPEFMKYYNKCINDVLQELDYGIQSGQDKYGDMSMAKALYYIYELDGKQEGSLQKAYDCLKQAEEKGNLLCRIYFKRKAFSQMDDPNVSARIKDA